MKPYVLSNKRSLLNEIKSIGNYADFFLVFSWRNLRLQYDSLWIGLFGGLISPLLLASIFYFTLNERIGTDFSHYFIYIYSGLIFWSVFANGLSQGHISFIQHSDLIKRAYFPRFLLPLTFLAARLPDFFIALFILSLFILISDIDIQWFRFFCFTFIGLMNFFLVSIGIYLLLSVIVVRHRGVLVIYHFLIQAMFFTSSILYDSKLSINNKILEWVINWNPFSTVLYTVREGVFPQETSLSLVLIHTLYALIICISGLLWFRAEDKYLVDRL